MYRICNANGSYELVQKMVSANLVHAIKLFLGEPDSNGNLSELKRLKDFMERVWYLEDLVGKEVSVGDGILRKEMSWEKIILSRYSDILAKLEDTKHEYTFDEFGEGLIFALVEARRDADLDYLNEYGVNPYSHAHDLVSFIDGGETESYKALAKAVEDEAPEFLREVLDDEYAEVEGYFRERDFDIKVFHEIFAKAYSLTLCNMACYLDEELGEEELDIAIEQHDVNDENASFIKEKLTYIFTSPILWDNDYMFVMEGLSGSGKLDLNLKGGLNLAGFTLKNYREIFEGKDESRDI